VQVCSPDARSPDLRQAFFYASAFSQLDGVPPPAPAQRSATQTVERWHNAQKLSKKSFHVKYKKGKYAF
jgi:hypothetical protein